MNNLFFKNNNLRFVTLILLCNIFLCYSAKIFESHRSGLWYPGSKNDLKQLLDSLDKRASIDYGMQVRGDQIVALISPHAGMQYSGEISAAVYRLLAKKKIKKIIILAPSHFQYFSGIALPEFDIYQTPLGKISVDKLIINKLKQNQIFSFVPSAYYPEHSIEMQLPFIQYYLPAAKIIPLIVGQINNDQIDQVAQCLKNLIDKNTIVVVSSDFIHYGPRFDYVPFNNLPNSVSNNMLIDDLNKTIINNIVSRVKKLDSDIFGKISQKNSQEFISLLDATKATVCGKVPIAILLKIIELMSASSNNKNKKNNNKEILVRLVGYQTSYSNLDEKSNIKDNNFVTYQGIIFTQESNNLVLNNYEKRSLLSYARQTLENSFNKDIVEESLIEPIITPPLLTRSGVFVTLYSHKNNKKELRGCIGTVISDKPMYKLVSDMSLAAAFKDSRFMPLQKKELKDIDIEISELTAPKGVRSFKDIVLNKHGIILTLGEKSALFLPNVAKDFNWDLPTTLEQLSEKAGLSKDAWKDKNVKFQVFEASLFKEDL